ncbi:hypothetical protein FQA39_LY01742 [Lamprigera yunnana]|nr:hypothetical protein FQA39_LY01742 [Lamprigera yunnana]
MELLRLPTITPETIVLVPHNERQFNSNYRRRGKTANLTSTPYKDELEEAIEKRKDKDKLNKQKVEKNIPKSKKVKKKIDKPNKPKKVGRLVLKKRTTTNFTELYSISKSHERWIKCQHCGGWAHEACAGVETDNTEGFSCDICNE